MLENKEVRPIIIFGNATMKFDEIPSHGLHQTTMRSFELGERRRGVRPIVI